MAKRSDIDLYWRAVGGKRKRPAIEIQSLKEEFSLILAVENHGKKKVRRAYKWLERGMKKKDRSAVARYKRIMKSDDPYAKLLASHRRATA
jgi:hypothetical protein